MFLRIYKNGNFFHAISIFVIAVVFWLPAFLSPAETTYIKSPGLIFDFRFSLLPESAFADTLVALLFVLTSGLIVNFLTVANDFSGKNSMHGLFLYVLLSAAFTTFMSLNPEIFASFFVLLMLVELFSLPKSNESIPKAFNASFFLGVASLFYLPLIVLLGVIILSLMTFRISTWRDYVVSIIGAFLPLLFAFVFYFFFDQQQEFLSKISKAFTIDFSIAGFSRLDLIIALLLAGLIVPSFIKINGTKLEKSILMRQKSGVINWLTLFLLLMLIVFEKQTTSWYLLVVPISIILTTAFNGVRKLKWADLYLTLIFFLILFSHYKVFFDA